MLIPRIDFLLIHAEHREWWTNKDIAADWNFKIHEAKTYDKNTVVYILIQIRSERAGLGFASPERSSFRTWRRDVVPAKSCFNQR